MIQESSRLDVPRQQLFPIVFESLPFIVSPAGVPMNDQQVQQLLRELRLIRISGVVIAMVLVLSLLSQLL